MISEALRESALGLFSICVAMAALEMITLDDRAALSFRSVCALGVAVSALRLVLRLVGK